MTTSTSASTGLGAAQAALVAGRSVLLLDEQPETGGALMLAADTATTAEIAFLIRYTAGYLRVAIADTHADRLRLPPMWPANQPTGSVDAVTVDARNHTTTGISAHDRARTVRTLGDPLAEPVELTRPGHVVPVRVPASLSPGSHDQASLAYALAKASGATGAAYCPLVSARDATAIARTGELRAFAAEHGITTVEARDVREHHLRTTCVLERAETRQVRLAGDEFRAIRYRDATAGLAHLGLTHLALVHGDPAVPDRVPLLVRYADPINALLGLTPTDAAEFARMSEENNAVAIYIDSRITELVHLDNQSSHADIVRDQVLTDLHIASTRTIH
ncbi:3,4-dihydroxy-2-butanone 4-phosphate synthase [Tamaricihabitans halophyticus]|uniref:3,4-dihydroxy-2-butanone-4-phosphate synthase n=1 Tax=Tamaricihabitans halophyticus TaxID=1262583 RepID=A0A4R2Q9I9_9PSEU|nr:3,4-dihydroxy-2-butanone-4-phosphate synthase [Tamaricihabitans halophyticus]TCP43425.1 3,4-dihydroxy-2-butanone 4-phosphate synthase [Tamaricihabitans halophyticus]